MAVKIYLRAILAGKDNSNKLALFDSKRHGDINGLITEVNKTDTIIWKLDCCSGIKSITGVHSSSEEGHTVFISEPKKRFLCKGFKLQLDLPEVKEERKEKYTIECILCDNTPLIIDPFIRVPPPPGR
jgi:hypothetical protein